MTARTEILRNIRRATASTASTTPAAVPRNYTTRGELAQLDLVALLESRLMDYGALVRRCSSTLLPAAVASALRDRGARRLAVPAGLPSSWLPTDVQAYDEHNLTPTDLDRLDGVVTAAALAIASTGTLVLDASPDQGRRVASLIPDYHLCIVRASQIVETVPEAMERISANAPLTWISGPSATSDIELNRVEGVHGPRTLEVLVVTELPDVTTSSRL